MPCLYISPSKYNWRPESQYVFSTGNNSALIDANAGYRFFLREYMIKASCINVAIALTPLYFRCKYTGKSSFIVGVFFCAEYSCANMGGYKTRSLFISCSPTLFFFCLLYNPYASRSACVNTLVADNLPLFLPVVIMVGVDFFILPFSTPLSIFIHAW